MLYNFPYYEFQKFDRVTKKKLGIKSEERYDLVKYFNQTNHKSFEFLASTRGKWKGSVKMRYTSSDKVIDKKIHKNRRCIANLEWSKNISGVFIDDFDNDKFAYGDLNSPKNLKIPSSCHSDGLLLIFNNNRTRIEIIVLPNRKAEVLTYYQRLSAGEYEREIEYLRENSVIFYNYNIAS